MTQVNVASKDMVPADLMETVVQQMAQLDTLLEASAAEDGNPDLKASMAAINKNLRQHPELIHLLTDEQIAPLYRTILAVNEVVLAPAKKKAARRNDKAETQAAIDSGNLFGL